MTLNPALTIKREWPGKTAVIIAGGPSLTLKQIRDISIARGLPDSHVRVIAVNDAVYVAWFADWLHACDAKWWRWNIQSVHQFRGRKTTLADDIPAQWVDGHLKISGTRGYDPDPSSCRTGKNSGYQAIHIAAHLGVKRVILVGFDMKKSSDGKAHWFGSHQDRSGNLVPRVMQIAFPSLAEDLVRCGVEVLNATIDSALECFPRIDLEEALKP